MKLFTYISAWVYFEPYPTSVVSPNTCHGSSHHGDLATQPMSPS